MGKNCRKGYNLQTFIPSEIRANGKDKMDEDKDESKINMKRHHSKKKDHRCKKNTGHRLRWSIHAEMMACSKFSKKQLRGATVYVVQLNPLADDPVSGNKRKGSSSSTQASQDLEPTFKISAPCEHCARVLRKLHLKCVYFSI